MFQVRRAKDRGYENKGWLETYHTFSFDTYYDRDFVGFRSLRVINEDKIQGGKGFPSHPHRDMEILTYVIDGILEHQDSIGNTSVIRPGEVQLMSAGTGVNHSERNFSGQLPVHFLQIWINPERTDFDPSYAQKLFSNASKWGQWCLVASKNARQGSLPLHQDVDIYATLLEQSDSLNFEMYEDRYYWIQVISGRFSIQGVDVEQGDGVSVNDLPGVEVHCLEPGEFLLFDLA